MLGAERKISLLEMHLCLIKSLDQACWALPEITGWRGNEKYRPALPASLCPRQAILLGALFSLHGLPLQVKSSHIKDSRNGQKHLSSALSELWLLLKASQVVGLVSWKSTPWTWFWNHHLAYLSPWVQSARDTSVLESSPFKVTGIWESRLGYLCAEVLHVHLHSAVQNCDGYWLRIRSEGIANPPPH